MDYGCHRSVQWPLCRDTHSIMHLSRLPVTVVYQKYAKASQENTGVRPIFLSPIIRKIFKFLMSIIGLCHMLLFWSKMNVTTEFPNKKNWTEFNQLLRSFSASLVNEGLAVKFKMAEHNVIIVLFILSLGWVSLKYLLKLNQKYYYAVVKSCNDWSNQEVIMDLQFVLC